MQGSDFAAIIPLTQGQNSITATATDADGRTKEASITVITNDPKEQIRITVNPESGILMTRPDGTTGFDATMSAETSVPYWIDHYAWDTNGDGAPEKKTGHTETAITASYQAPGLYFPTVTVTDTLWNEYTETAIVNVIDRNALDALLNAKWEGMKAALAKGDIATAVSYFTSETKDRYQEIFTALLPQLPQFVQEMQEIQLIYMNSGIAKYRIRKNEIYSGQTMAITYYIYFALDENGLWKIKKF